MLFLYTKGKIEKPSLIQTYNELFVMFFKTFSWIIYLFGTIIIVICLIYFIKDWQRQNEMRRRRIASRQANTRLPQKRRLSAAARDHEIYRYVLQEVNKYMKDKNINRKFVCRISSSGSVYGGFVDEDSKIDSNNTFDSENAKVQNKIIKTVLEN